MGFPSGRYLPPASLPLSAALRGRGIVLLRAASRAALRQRCCLAPVCSFFTKKQTATRGIAYLAVQHVFSRMRAREFYLNSAQNNLAGLGRDAHSHSGR